MENERVLTTTRECGCVTLDADLIALHEPHPELFREIPWSTDRVFETTISIARRHGLSVTLLPEWYDVDSVADLRRVAGDSGAKRTKAWMATAPL